MTNPYNGDGPNVGANDSARILQLTDSDCRDYRPSIQLAMVLFSKVKAYTDNEKLNTPLLWLGLEFPKEVLKPAKSCVMNQGGYCVLRRTQSMVMLRYPRFRFRPSQADAMHVDLWVKDQNLLSDAGTYSYNTDARWLKYFRALKAIIPCSLMTEIRCLDWGVFVDNGLKTILFRCTEI